MVAGCLLVFWPHLVKCQAWGSWGEHEGYFRIRGQVFSGFFFDAQAPVPGSFFAFGPKALDQAFQEIGGVAEVFEERL